MKARPVQSFGDGIDLAIVDPRVEVAQRLGDRLDALVERAGLREERACGLVVTGLVGGDEVLDCGDELTDLVLHERTVEVDGLLLLLGVWTFHRDAIPGHGERGLPHAIADHPRLAESEVVTGLCDDRERARGGRRDVLDLADDPEAVLCEEVELRDLSGVVLDVEGQGPALRGRRGDRAVAIGRGDVEGRGGSGVALRDAAAQDENRGAGGCQRPQDPVRGGHAAPCGEREGDSDEGSVGPCGFDGRFERSPRT